MNSKIKLAFGVVVFALSCLRPAVSQERMIALLKDTMEAPSTILVGKPGAALILIASDQRPKDELRWVPGGQRLSYRVRDENGALTRLVIIDLAGKTTKEIPIEPVTDPPSERPRFIADIIWLTESKFRVIGSINNWNCETYDMDWQTNEYSNPQFGECVEFVTSPDGKHTAYLSQTSAGRDEERYEGVQIDGGGEERAQGTPGPIVFRGANKSVFRIISHLVWSEDSKRLAFLKKTVGSGEVAVAFLSLDGTSYELPLSAHFGDDGSETTLTWLGDALAVRDEAEMVVIGGRDGKRVNASAELVARVEHQREARKATEKHVQALDALRKQYGAREAVAWPE